MRRAKTTLFFLAWCIAAACAAIAGDAFFGEVYTPAISEPAAATGERGAGDAAAASSSGEVQGLERHAGSELEIPIAERIAKKFGLRPASSVLQLDETASIYEAVSDAHDKFSAQLQVVDTRLRDAPQSPDLIAERLLLRKGIAERALQMQMLDSDHCLAGPPETISGRYLEIVMNADGYNVILMNQRHTPKSGQVIFLLRRSGEYQSAIQAHHAHSIEQAKKQRGHQ